MIIGLLVPLMLITKTENARQNNLPMGLLFILVTGVLSAVVAIVNNYATDADVPILSTLLFTVSGIFCGSTALFVYKQGFVGLRGSFVKHFSLSLLITAALRSLFVVISVALVLFAYTAGGTLAVVQTIYSLYILIPIVLAIIFYNEHWNWQKALAITLSVVSLAFLG